MLFSSVFAKFIVHKVLVRILKPELLVDAERWTVRTCLIGFCLLVFLRLQRNKKQSPSKQQPIPAPTQLYYTNSPYYPPDYVPVPSNQCDYTYYECNCLFAIRDKRDDGWMKRITKYLKEGKDFIVIYKLI